MKMKRLMATIVATGLAGLWGLAHASDDFEYRISLNTPKWELGERTVSKTNFEARMPELSRIGYYRIGQKFHTTVFETWQLGTSPAWERSRRGDGSWADTYRVEFELNPSKIKLGENGPSLGLRNRWELRWKEGRGSEHFHRLRQQGTVTWKLGGGFFDSYGMGYELFYELDKDTLTMSRFFPLILSTGKLGDFGTQLYVMHQSKRSNSEADWDGALIIGTGFSF